MIVVGSVAGSVIGVGSALCYRPGKVLGKGPLALSLALLIGFLSYHVYCGVPFGELFTAKFLSFVVIMGVPSIVRLVFSIHFMVVWACRLIEGWWSNWPSNSASRSKLPGSDRPIYRID